jgi:hypothetical protein
VCRNSVSNWTPVPSIASQMYLGFFFFFFWEKERERKKNFVGWRMTTFQAGSKSFRESFFSEDDKRSLILYMHMIRSVRPLSSIGPLRKTSFEHNTQTARIDLHWHSKIRDRVTFFRCFVFFVSFFSSFSNVILDDLAFLTRGQPSYRWTYCVVHGSTWFDHDFIYVTMCFRLNKLWNVWSFLYFSRSCVMAYLVQNPVRQRLSLYRPVCRLFCFHVSFALADEKPRDFGVCVCVTSATAPREIFPVRWKRRWHFSLLL